MNETVPHHEIQLLCIWHPSHDACRDEQCSSPHGPDGVLLKMIEQTLQVRCVNPPRYDQHRTYDNRGNMWETLTAADSEKRWHWWWLIRLLLWVCADWFTDALLRLFGRNNLRPHWNVTVEPSIRKLPEFGGERSDGTWPECFRASTVSMTIVAEASYEVTDVQTCWQFYFY